MMNEREQAGWKVEGGRRVPLYSRPALSVTVTYLMSPEWDAGRAREMIRQENAPFVSAVDRDSLLIEVEPIEVTDL